MFPSPESNERQLSLRLQPVLVPFDRQIEWGNTLLATAMVVAVPGTFLALWLLTDLGAKQSLGWSVGMFALVLLLSFLWDALITRLALWRFERAFPQSDPLRSWAIVYLQELDLATCAEERLRDLLMQRWPHAASQRLMRPSSGSLPLGLDAPPAIEPTPPQQIRIGSSWGDQGQEKAQELIPLEPRQPR
ncbi:MAG: hypothetical protein SNJ75_05290 [Gemmataceae bacterium]